MHPMPLFTSRLRLAYHVGRNKIPRELVVNGDQTGIHFTQHKGKGWFTPADVKAGNKSIDGFGDKRQFTLLITISAAGCMLPG